MATRLWLPVLILGLVTCETSSVRHRMSPPEYRTVGERVACRVAAPRRAGDGGEREFWGLHEICGHNLARLGELVDRRLSDADGSPRGGGPSGLDLLQSCAERYRRQITAALIRCPLADPSIPTRLPNGVLRITHRNASYRVRAGEITAGDRDSRTILLYEARPFDGGGRWVLFGDSTARWIEEKEFRRLARDQDLYGLPPELRIAKTSAGGQGPEESVHAKAD